VIRNKIERHSDYSTLRLGIDVCFQALTVRASPRRLNELGFPPRTLIFPIDIAFRLGYIPSMAWEVEYSDEFGAWWEGLSEAEQVDIAPVVNVLAEHGPSLRRPYSGTIQGSKHANMKELVIQHAGRPYRVLYAFDPRRNAFLLIGGDKSGNSKWYEEYVPRAEKILDEHLEQLKKEGLI